MQVWINFEAKLIEFAVLFYAEVIMVTSKHFNRRLTLIVNRAFTFNGTNRFETKTASDQRCLNWKYSRVITFRSGENGILDLDIS